MLGAHEALATAASLCRCCRDLLHTSLSHCRFTVSLPTRYALVGLEQTAESTQLPAFTFPTKTVLVLGREKEGIPPEVIALLDATVEIPQLGVIRSLNVHVSGAIAMYEYVKQQLRSS